MRKFVAASLALSPMMMYAQANSPAQPKNASFLESRLVTPSTADTTTRVNTSAPLRISTGVIAPKLIHSESITPSTDNWAYHVAGIDQVAVVSMLVDANGVPSDLKIVKSVSPEMDKNVLAAVSRYRFQPGTLNNAPTAVPVKLEITIQNAIR